ncbi:MAG: hypothetical protein IKY01_07415 [Prevotella sp.]|nr:hypothetical protein [Prevotella sp.]MBR5989201.1 hypothetical protein [Prevotella sp.]
MKRVLFALTVMAVALCSCGSKSGGASSSSESTSSGLADGKWPAAIYDKYGIPEIETKGRIVCTQFEDTEGSYQYEVYYNGVTKEEMQAWVKKLQEKGFRVPKYTQERIDNGHRDYDAFLYQPGDQKDKRLRLQFDFDNPMSFEYYADEPNPAFEVVERDGEQFIDYNLTVSLNPLKDKVELTGAIEALGLKAEDLAGIPGVRVVRMSDSQMGPGMDIGFFSDHQLTQETFNGVHKKILDVLTAKGCTFQHAFSGKDMTPEQLTESGIHSYGVKLNDQKFIMMAISDDRVGDFGGGIKFMFTKARK